MVPFLTIALSSIFRVFDVHLALCMTAHSTTPGPCPAEMVTFGGAEWDWDRFSKVRARQCLENEQGYKFISGLYRLGPKLRPASGPQKTISARQQGPRTHMYM